MKMVRISEEKLGELRAHASMLDAALANARKNADRAWHAEHVLRIALQEKQDAIEEAAKLRAELAQKHR